MGVARKAVGSPLFKDFLHYVRERRGEEGLHAFLKRAFGRAPYERAHYASFGAEGPLYVGGKELRYLGPALYPHLLPLFTLFNVAFHQEKGSRWRMEGYTLKAWDGLREEVVEWISAKGWVSRRFVGRNKGRPLLLPFPLLSSEGSPVVVGDGDVPLLQLEGLPEASPYGRCIVTHKREVTKHHLLPYSLVKTLKRKLSTSPLKGALEVYNYFLRIPLSREVHNLGGWNVEQVTALLSADASLTLVDAYILLLNLSLLERTLHRYGMALLREKGIFVEHAIYHNLSREAFYQSFLEVLEALPAGMLYNTFTMYAPTR